MVSPAILKVMEDAGAARWPEEACGLVVRCGKKLVAIECRNVDPSPRSAFTLSTEDYAAAAATGEIVACWHTHPNGDPTPSAADIEGCRASDMPWYVLGVGRDGEHFNYAGPRAINPKGGEELDYLDRPYVYGVHDCLSLVADFYRREYGITLKQRPRADKFWLQAGTNPLVDGYAEDGFVKLIDAEPKRGDVFLIQTTPLMPNHVAVYLGGDLILHHCAGRLSGRDVYGGGYWHKHTTHHLRHESQC